MEFSHQKNEFGKCEKKIIFYFLNVAMPDYFEGFDGFSNISQKSHWLFEILISNRNFL